MMMVVMNWTVAMMMYYMPASVIMATMTLSECRPCTKNDRNTSNSYFYHFIHLAPSLSPHLAVTIR
jgi:hypothetical protein